MVRTHHLSSPFVVEKAPGLKEAEKIKRNDPFESRAAKKSGNIHDETSLPAKY